MQSLSFQLRQNFSSGSLSPILLLTGPKTIEDIAKELAREVLSSTTNHPDFHEYQPQGKADLHPIESIYLFTEEMYKPPYSASHKVFIFYDTHKMSPFSSNALLKTLEEPAHDAYVILLAPQKNLLLPTILSRASHYRLELPFEDSVKEIIEQGKVILQGMIAKSPYYTWMDALQEVDPLFQEKTVEEKKAFFLWVVQYFSSFLHSLIAQRRYEEKADKAIQQIERGGKLSASIEYLYLSFEDLSRTEVPNQPNLERKVAK